MIAQTLGKHPRSSGQSLACISATAQPTWLRDTRVQNTFKHIHACMSKCPRTKHHFDLNTILFLKPLCYPPPPAPNSGLYGHVLLKKKLLVSPWTEGAMLGGRSKAKSGAKGRNIEYGGVVGSGGDRVFSHGRAHLRINPGLAAQVTFMQLCSLFLFPLTPLSPPLLLFPSLSLYVPQPSLRPSPPV